MNRIRKIKQVLRSRPTIEGVGVHLKRAFGFIGGRWILLSVKDGAKLLSSDDEKLPCIFKDDVLNYKV